MDKTVLGSLKQRFTEKEVNRVLLTNEKVRELANRMYSLNAWEFYGELLSLWTYHTPEREIPPYYQYFTCPNEYFEGIYENLFLERHMKSFEMN